MLPLLSLKTIHSFSGQAPMSWPPVLMTSSEVNVGQRLFAVVLVFGWTTALLWLIWSYSAVRMAALACFSLFALSPLFAGVDSIVLHNHHTHTKGRSNNSTGGDIKGK